MKILGWLDRLAGWWLDKRMDQLVQKGDPELQKFDLHKAEYHPGSAEIVAFAPSVVVLAEQAANLLNAQHVENYLVFDLMPRLDRGLKPITVTVQWADKLSPAQKNTQLARENEELKAHLDRFSNAARAVLNHIYEFEHVPDGEVLDCLEKQLEIQEEEWLKNRCSICGQKVAADEYDSYWRLCKNCMLLSNLGEYCPGCQKRVLLQEWVSDASRCVHCLKGDV